MKNQEESGWQAFLTLCSKMQKEKFLQDLFSLFLSFSERKDVASRYHIIRALLEGGAHSKRDSREIRSQYRTNYQRI